ncbi:Putative ribonuclease H protein At1g65750 [Linum perenne]
MRCVERFCGASGESISKEKSTCFCSPNTPRSISAGITGVLGFPLTQDLGRYLGVPTLHEKTSARTYQGIVDRIEQKLTGWKAKSLSLAGRVTLAQSVLTSIPAYVMQTAVIPVTTCDAIDRQIRNFVWGSTDEARRVHLVSWDRICTPKEDGGLGLKMAKFLNRAYMTKLSFIFFQEPDRLWVKVLQSKYFKESAAEIIDCVVGMLPPKADSGEDLWVWGGEADGRFSIKSAYNLIYSHPGALNPQSWKTIWSWKGPNRTRLFLWLAIQEKLLTNSERLKRQMTPLGTCGFVDWLCRGLQSKDGLLFRITCWQIWRARNERIFSNASALAPSVAFRAANWSRTVVSTSQKNSNLLGVSRARQMVDVAWDPGPEDWVTCNSDGSADPATGKAAAGGLVRDANGKCLLAFTMNTGNCSVTRAELRGAVEGLRRSWNAGFRKVILQLDSRAAIAILTSGKDPGPLLSPETADFKDLQSRNWELVIKHVYREGNRAADFLASIGYDYPFGSHSVSSLNCNLGYFLRLDCSGISEQRSILIND